MAGMRGVVLRLAAPGPAARAVALAVLLGALVAGALLVPVPDLAAVRAWVAGFGPAAPVAFAVVYALAVPAPFPKSVLSTTAGLAFGIPLGSAAVIVGGLAGCVLSFLLARRLGRDAVARLTRGRVERVDALIERHGVLAALAVRVVPVLPFTLVNYACGVTSMRLRHYALGTLIDSIPKSIAIVALGSIAGGISPWIPAGASLTLAAITLSVGALVHHHRRPSSPPPPPPPPPSPSPSSLP